MRIEVVSLRNEVRKGVARRVVLLVSEWSSEDCGCGCSAGDVESLILPRWT